MFIKPLVAPAGPAYGSFAVDTDGDLGERLLFYSRQDDAADASGNNADGTVTAVTYASQIIGNGGTYNGSTSKMVFSAPNLNIDSTDTMSWSFWVNVKNGANYSIMSRGANISHTGIGWTIMYSDPYIYLQLNAASGFPNDETQLFWWLGNAPTGMHHVAMSYNGTLGGSSGICYVDGVLQSVSVNAANLAGSILNPTADLIIGGDTVSLGYWDLDEIGIFTGVFSANNVADLYNSGAGNAFTSP